LNHSEGTVAEVLAGEADWCVECADNAVVLPTLPDRSVAHVITDPPYIAAVHAKQRSGNDPGNNHVLGFAPLTAELRASTASAVGRIVSRWSLVFTDLESAGAWMADLALAGLDPVRIGVWVRVGAAPQFTGDRPASACEAIAIAHPPGRKSWNGGGLHAVWMFGVEHVDRVHETQKPLPLMLRLIDQFTDPGELILDPFCGSGSTGVACLRLGRRCILIERDPVYAATARERMRAETQGLSLRDARAGQLSLLAVDFSRGPG
jgi:site-specific DNA-methyltransferase (adenine-specific)